MMTLIVDSKLLAYNELHANKPIVNLFSSLIPMIKRIEAKTFMEVKELVFVYDIGKSDYRLGLWPEYKGKRNYGSQPDNFKSTYETVIPKLANCLGVSNYPIRGVEADDLAGILHKKLDTNIMLITGDHDWMQLVLREPEKTVYFNVKNWELLDAKAIIEYTGCYTEEQFLIKKSILGDSGDNIIGIPSIGPVKFNKWKEEAFNNGECLKKQFIELCHKANDKNKTHRDYCFNGVSSCEELYDFNMKLGTVMSGIKHLTEKQKVDLNAAYVYSKTKPKPNLENASMMTKEYNDGYVGPFGDEWFLSPEELSIYERIFYGKT